MENDTRSLGQEELTTWRTVLRAQANVTSALDKELNQTHKLGLSDYDVLSCLGEAPDHSLRMTELAYGVLLSPSGLTRRLDGLVKQGLVERRPSPSDGRGLLAVLTEAGEIKRGEMEPTYTKALQVHFINCLEPQQLKEISTMFQPIAEDRDRVSIAKG